MSFPENFDPSLSVLFLGAGFSHSAINISLKQMPLAGGLEVKLKDSCGLPNDDPSSLLDLAGYANRMPEVDLNMILHDTFTASKLTDSQRAILSKPWLRIYTTNYDDCVELYFNSIRKPLKDNSFSTGEPVPRKLNPGAVIHLHGYIHRCTPENVLDQLVLTHFSYAQQRAISSPWWEVFERDIRFCEHIFFLGYELNDFEPAKYLTMNPSYTSKSYFILIEAKSPVAASKLDVYGQRFDFGVDGFSEKCKAAVLKPKPTHPNALASFVYFEPFRDKKTLAKPTPIEIDALFSVGQFDQRKLFATFPDSKYMLIRENLILSCYKKIQNNKTIVVHSKIGNGKTLFLKSLATHLSSNQYNCFYVRPDSSPSSDEIEFISGMEKVVLIFEDYDTAYKIIKILPKLRDDARFLLEVTTSTQFVRYSELASMAPGPLVRVDVNKLEESDLVATFNLLDEAGICPPDFKERFREGTEFRDIVLSVFENVKVVERVDSFMRPIISSSEAKYVFLCSSILKILGLHTEPGFLRSIAKVDVYAVLTSVGESVHEIMSFSSDRIEPHSSIFSEFIVKRYLKAFELAGAIFRLASEAARRMNETTETQSERARAGRSLLGALLRFSFLSRLFEGHADQYEQIGGIYEESRRDVNIQIEPLFWLQYSIFRQNTGRTDLAIRHMETAYERAKASPGFLTYQLDTNSLGLYLDVERSKESTSPFTYAARLIELLDAARRIVGEKNHRAHVLRSLLKVYPTFEKRRGGLSKVEAEALSLGVKLIVDILRSFSPNERAEWGTDVVANSLDSAVSILISKKKV